MKDRIEKLIELVAKACISWIKEKNGEVLFVDPIDHDEISAHYGATHAAVALIIYGKEKQDSSILKLGEDLLFSIFRRWDKNKLLPDFHNDFNNYALCVLDSYMKDYHGRIQEIVLRTVDSNHDTVNWLPMRWFVNKCRHEWTDENKYLANCKVCANKIKRATFNDGFIDDRLPVGLSFNLQYDVATVAVMQFLRITGEEIDLSKELAALLNVVCPDGDINYLGRGSNQIFAWGLWVYLLASSKQEELDRALRYIEKRLPTMLDNNNIMLNDYPGEAKYMWWDYHYCSVYIAHFLLWLVLAWKDVGKAEIFPVLIEDGSSGVHVYKNENFFVATFDGRTEYLAERGPVISAIWTKKYGVICKGTFGPWYGAFGNKHIRPDVVTNNYMGFQRIIHEREAKNRLVIKLSKLFPHPVQSTIRPLFCNFSIDIEEMKIVWRFNTKLDIRFNAAINKDIDEKCISIIDGIGRNQLLCDMYIQNQYGCTKVLHTKQFTTDNCTILIQ